MSARLPSLLMRLFGLLMLAWIASCDAHRATEWDEGDAGPCGRGKARSCTCEDGTRGIAHCVVGGDWGECICNPNSLEIEADAGEAGEGSGPSLVPWTDDPLRDCEATFDFRAHGAGDFGAPYRVPPRRLLAGSQRVCFYFRVPYADGSVALGFSGLLYETPGLRSWMLYGLDTMRHGDGEVAPCNGAEPGAYLLAGFAPGVDDLKLPKDVGLALPRGDEAGVVLEVQYEPQDGVELLDRTGVRVCAARTSARKKTAAVHLTGTQGICILPGARGQEVRGSCVPRIDVGPIHVIDVWPSMHQRGRRMQIAVQRANGERQILHDAPFFFDDQRRFPQRDVVLWPGDTLDTRCYYDNPNLFAVPFGPSADEETCFGFVTAWPAGALSSRPLGELGDALGIQPDKSCLEPAGILSSCNGPADAL